MLRRQPPPGRVATVTSPSSRTVTIELRDLIGGLGNDACIVDINVNGAVQHGGVALTGNSTSRTLTVQRGENLVQLVATQGHVIGYDTVGGSKYVALEVTFPDADQLDRSRGAYLNPGDTRDFALVVSPPL